MSVEKYRVRVRDALNGEMPPWAWKGCLTVAIVFMLVMLVYLAVESPWTILWLVVLFGGISGLGRFITWLMRT